MATTIAPPFIAQNPATELLTAERYFRECQLDRSELINGKVIELMPPGGLHGKLMLRIGGLLSAFVLPHKLGELYGESGFILSRDPDTVRGPDVAFLEASRVPPPHEEVFLLEGAPTLAIEILSPNDRKREVEAKVRLYFEKGTREVWIVDPSTKTVSIRNPNSTAIAYGIDDAIPGGDILPGFSLPVRSIFE